MWLEMRIWSTGAREMEIEILDSSRVETTGKESAQEGM